MADTLAIVGGTGHLGYGLAIRWAHAGAQLIIGSRDKNKAAKTVERIDQQLGKPSGIQIDDYAGAASRADIVVLAVPFHAQPAALKEIAPVLTPGKMVLDTTVPLAGYVGGRFTRTLGVWQGSAAEQAAELVPDGVKVAAAFHTVAAGVLERWPDPIDADVLVTGDDADAKRRVSDWIEKIPDLRGIDAGPLELSRVTEQMTALLISINSTYKAGGCGVRLTNLTEVKREEKS